MVDNKGAKESKMKNKTTPVSMAAGFFLLLIAIGVLGPLYGQLQQSGGAGTVVTASQGGTWNINNISGTVALPTGAATSAKQPTFATAGSPSADVVTVQGATGMAALQTAPKTACGATAFTPAWQVVPTSSTALTATTSCVVAILVTNTNASAQTVTITDGQGTPVTVLSAFSIPANSEVTLPFFGAQMTSGIKWTAGGAGLTGTVVAYQ
jgi:hypothetical protein